MTASGATPLGRNQFTLRRMFLYLHIVAVVCAAFVGSAQILTGWDDEFRALLTAAVVAAGSLCGLVCGAALESRRARITPIGGLVSTIVGVACMMPLIWIRESRWDNLWFERWLKVTLVICTIAVSESHISLLSLCRLAPRYSWAKHVAIAAILAVAGLVVGIVVMDCKVSDVVPRWTVVAAIVDAAMTILIPVFHLLSRKGLSTFQFTLGRMFLYLHLVAVVCAAFIGSAQILTRSDDDLRALLTAATVAAGSICGLVCGVALDSRRARVIPVGGLALTLVGVVCMLLLIWQRWGSPSWDWSLRVTLIICTLAALLTHISLLSLCRLAPRFSWAKVVGVVAILAVAGLVVAILLISHHHSKVLLRWTADAAIVDAAMSILIPVFHLLSRKELSPAPAEAPLSLDAPQFSLRTLLIFTTVSAALFGLLARWTYYAQQQRAAVGLWRVRYDFQTRYSPGNNPPYWPTWLVNALGIDYVATVSAVDFCNAGTTDADLEHLKELTSLRELDLCGNVTDVGLEHLKGLTKLQTLRISSSNVTDAGLEHLKGLTSLKTLYIGGTKVTGVGLGRLKTALPNFKIEY